MARARKDSCNKLCTESCANRLCDVCTSRGSMRPMRSSRFLRLPHLVSGCIALRARMRSKTRKSATVGLDNALRYEAILRFLRKCLTASRMRAYDLTRSKLCLDILPREDMAGWEDRAGWKVLGTVCSPAEESEISGDRVDHRLIADHH